MGAGRSSGTIAGLEAVPGTSSSHTTAELR